MAVVMAIDTSNYTTSISVLKDKNILCDKRQLLTVEVGKKGLQQSEAVFQHLKNLPILMEKVKRGIGNNKIDAIGVSSKPRPAENSYMPVFTAGENFSLFLSNFLDIPIYRFSHQEGHIESIIYSEKLHLMNEFLSLHLSGGTTEILKVKANGYGFDVHIIGGTQDLNAGQFIDRIGVSLGYGFPCGKIVDELSLKGDSKKYLITPYVRDTFMSFSGPETAAQRLISSGKFKEDICASVMENIALSIYKSLKNALNIYNIDNIIFAGGVSSSRYLRMRLAELFKDTDLHLHFGNPEVCSDNSIGIASLTMKMYEKERK